MLAPPLCATSLRHFMTVTSVKLTLGTIRRISARRVVHGPTRAFLPLERESRLFFRPPDDERQAQRLTPAGRVERVELEVVVGKRLPARAQLRENACRIAHVEHRLPVH